MKYKLKMSCGHEQIVHLSGSQEERRKKILKIQAGVCKNCFNNIPVEEKKEELASNKIILDAGYLPYIDENTGALMIYLIFSNNVSEQYEHILKEELGFKKTFAWKKQISESHYKETIKNIQEKIPCEIRFSEQKTRKESAKEKQKRWVKPPDFIQGKKWNRKFYGNNIYLDGKQVKLSVQQKKELEDYVKKTSLK